MCIFDLFKEFTHFITIETFRRVLMVNHILMAQRVYCIKVPKVPNQQLKCILKFYLIFYN